jgi:hypothetical protein
LPFIKCEQSSKTFLLEFHGLIFEFGVEKRKGTSNSRSLEQSVIPKGERVVGQTNISIEMLPESTI